MPRKISASRRQPADRLELLDPLAKPFGLDAGGSGVLQRPAYEGDRQLPVVERLDRLIGVG